VPSPFCTVSIQKIASSDIVLAFATTNGILRIPPGEAVEMEITSVLVMFWPAMAANRTEFGLSTVSEEKSSSGEKKTSR